MANRPNEERPGSLHALGLALSAAWLVLGCVYDPGALGEVGGSGGGTDTPTNLAGTDLQVCGDACATLAGCGASLDQNQCKIDCANNPGVVTCFRSVTPACDPLASCVWSAVCNGATPSGSQACGAGESCAIGCSDDNNPLCLCGCASQLRPDASAKFYALVTCLNMRCNPDCGLGGDMVSCDDCLASQCAPATAQCN
jgi:hypothetical protein